MTLHYCTPSVSLFYMDVETDNQYKEPKVNTKIILLGKGRSHENKLRSSFGFCPNYRNFFVRPSLTNYHNDHMHDNIMRKQEKKKLCKSVPSKRN